MNDARQSASPAAEIRGGLRWIRMPAGTELGRFPDFFIVGPQRTGTSWLYVHLRFHPEILLSRPKEIYFFSSLRNRDPRRYVTDDLGWYLRYFRDPAWMWAVKTGVCLFRFGKRYKPRVRGEATASYATLEPDVIDDVVRLNPAIKVILMVRNPVDRAWSDAKFSFARQRRRMEDVGSKELKNFFMDDYQRRCAAYTACHDTWSARLRPGHLFLGRFDEIATQPRRILLDVMRFLGVADDPRFVHPAALEPVNTTSTLRISDDHRHFLQELFADELERLRDRFGMSWS